MRLEILGRVQLATPDGPVRLTELELGLLALAALHGRVGVDSLSEWLWDGDPPSSARNRVQSLVSGIRRKTGGDAAVIVTDGRGYRLGESVRVDAQTWVDAVGAARLERSGSPESALAHYDRALAVFDHDPLVGAPHSAAVEVERNRLAQERLSVLEERHDAALRAGVLEGLVAELDALTARHPYHEGFTALFMLALAANGQQSRALEVFQDARARLDEELGVRPSDQLNEAQRLVLAGATVVQPAPGTDPPTGPAPPAVPGVAPGGDGAGVGAGRDGGAAPVTARDADAAAAREDGPVATLHGLPVPRTLPRRPRGFVGRDEELREIVGSAAGVDHEAVLVSVTGLPGCGKSALALEAGHRLREAFPDGTLYHDGANDPGGVPVDAVITAFLPLLGVHPEAVPADPMSRAGLFRSLLDGRRVLVVVDNVACSHEAGSGQSCGIIDLLPASPGSMALVTSRRPVDDLVATHRVRLRSLPPEPARALLVSLVGADRVAEEPEACADVLRLTGGMPLALRLAVGRLAQRPDLSLEELADRLERVGHGPAGTDEIAVLRESLERIVADLSPEAQQVVEAVAHLPVDTFSGWVPGALLHDRSAGDAAVDAMVEVSLVEPVIREGHSAQFRLHDLVRSHVRASAGRGATAARTAPEHPQTLAEVVAVAEAAVVRTGGLLGALPQRFIPAPPRPAGSVAPTTPTPRRAGRRFFRTETPMLVSLATRLTTERPDLAWRLLADTALGTGAATDLHAWFEAEATVTAALSGADDDSRLGAATLVLCRAWLLQDRRSASREAAELADSARPRLVLLGAHGAAAAAALVSAQAATSLGLRPRAEAAIATAEASLAHVADPILTAWAAIARGTLHNDYDELEDSAREFTRARAILADSPGTVAYALATLELSRARRRTGELGPATLLVDEALETLSGIGAVHMYSYALDARAEVSLASGQPRQAAEEAESALERATASRDSFLRARARRTRGRALLAAGSLEEARSELATAVEEFTAIDRPLSVAFTYQVLAAALDAAGDAAGASEALRLEQAALRRASDSRAAATAQRRSPGPA